MIALLAVAFADDCAKLDDDEKQTIATYLESEASTGRTPTNKAVKTAKKLDAKGRLCTPDDKAHAAYLLSTGFDPHQTERAYVLAQEAMAGFGHGAVELVPQTYDRHRVALGLPQRFATLVGYENGRQCLFPVDDPAPDDERKAYKLEPLLVRLKAFGEAIQLNRPVKSYADLASNQAVCTGVGGGKRVVQQR